MICARCAKHCRNSDFFHCQGCPELFCRIARGSCNGFVLLHCEGFVQCRSMEDLIAKGSCNGLVLLYYEGVAMAPV